MKKTVLITGASRGIGKAIALEFAQNGYNVGINYLNSDESALDVKNTAIAYGADAETFKYDISSSNGTEALVKDFIERFSNIDVLINNAGISKIAPISDTSIEEWNAIINTNLSSAFYLCKALLPYFLKLGHGNIINISSIWGVSGASCEVAYSASKAGLIGFTQALSRELAPSQIRVNSISPGIIDTDMNKTIDATSFKSLIDEIPLERAGLPLDIAKTALFLASDDSKYITGQNIIVDGGYI